MIYYAIIGKETFEFDELEMATLFCKHAKAKSVNPVDVYLIFEVQNAKIHNTTTANHKEKQPADHYKQGNRNADDHTK